MGFGFGIQTGTMVLRFGGGGRIPVAWLGGFRGWARLVVAEILRRAKSARLRMTTTLGMTQRWDETSFGMTE